MSDVYQIIAWLPSAWKKREVVFEGTQAECEHYQRSILSREKNYRYDYFRERNLLIRRKDWEFYNQIDKELTNDDLQASYEACEREAIRLLRRAEEIKSEIEKRTAALQK